MDRNSELKRIEKMQVSWKEELAVSREELKGKISSLEIAGTSLEIQIQCEALQKQIRTIEDNLISLELIRLPGRKDNSIGPRTWHEAIEHLQIEEMGTTAELYKLAADKARSRLSEYHQYADDGLDFPLLNCDSVELMQDD